MLKGKRLLITGLTGQIGSSVARILAPDNELIGLARYTRPGSREEAEALGVRAVACDYTSGDLSGVPDDVDYVLHIAADVYPANFDVGVQQNAEGAGLLFNHFKKAKAWIYVSTTGVYWDHPDPWYRYKEGDRLGGSTRITSRFPYGPTKFAGEAVARTMSRIHGVPLTIPRMNWSYGAGGHGGLPGGLIASIYEGRPVKGDGNARCGKWRRVLQRRRSAVAPGSPPDGVTSLARATSAHCAKFLAGELPRAITAYAGYEHTP